MVAILLTCILTSLLAFTDLFLSHFCMQPYMACTLAYYVLLLYTRHPFPRIMVVFFALMVVGHFLYGNELRLFWYLLPLSLAGSLGQQLRISKKYQPAILLALGILAHQWVMDGIIPLHQAFSCCTTLASLVTLILVALISLK